MLEHRFNEQEVRRLTIDGALGWCQYEGEKPEHGYLLVVSLADGQVCALDRPGWHALCQNPTTRTKHTPVENNYA